MRCLLSLEMQFPVAAGSLLLPAMKDAVIFFSRAFHLIFLGVIFSCSICSVYGNEIKKNEMQTVRVGAYMNPPKIYTTADGSVVGLFSDLLEQIADREGWNIEYIWGTWNECLERLENSEIDIMVDVAYSKKRALLYNFSDETVLINWGVIYTKEKNPIQTILDLNGKTVAVMKNSIHTEGQKGIKSLVEKFEIDCEFIEVDNYEQVLKKLHSGEVDAGVVNRLFGSLYSDKLDLIPSPIVFNPRHLKFAFPKESAFGVSLKHAVDTNLKEMKQQSYSVYYKIVEAYMSGIDRPWAVSETDDSQGRIPMSVEEKAWVKNHQNIRLGFDPEFAPFEYISKGNVYKGLAAEFVQLIEKRIGVNFVPFPELTWNETIDRAKQGEIDVLPCVGVTEERKKWFLFSDSYLSFPRVIVTTAESDIKSAGELVSLRVAVQENSSHHGYIMEKTKIEPVLFPTFKEAMFAVSKGNVDAAMGNLAVATHFIREYGFSNLKITTFVSDEVFPLSFAVRKDWTVLHGLINRALQSITPKERASIQKRWLPIDMVDLEPQFFQTLLTLKEQEWITNHPVIYVCSDPNAAPIEFQTDDGIFSGIAIEYLKRFAKRLGVTFENIKIDQWEQGFEKMKAGEIDMFSAVVETDLRKKTFFFTTPYLEIPIVVFTNRNMTYIGDLKELSEKNIVVVKGYAAQEMVVADYPFLRERIIPAETVEKALQMVEKGEADAYIGSILSAGYYIGKLKTATLKVAGKTPYTARVSMAVRKDLEPLAGILQKCMDSIPESEKNALYRKWVSIRYDHYVDCSTLIKAVGFVLCLLFISVYWVKRLKTEISHRERIEIELISARKEAEKANRIKSSFLANMSHEIRTPMNAILGYSQLLNRDSNLTNDQKQSLLTINKSGEHLLSLINNILEISKIESGRYVLEPCDFDLFELLDDLEVMFKLRTEKKGLVFKIIKSERLIRVVKADESKIKQILINLVGNAVKFTNSGSILIRADIENERADNNKESNSKKTLVIEVEDTGMGIAQENLKKIFESFEQAEGRSVQGGTGLGLAISRKYANLMNGDIFVKSEKGKGSLFEFRCEIESGSKTALIKQGSYRNVIGIKEKYKDVKVLVADDRETNRDLLKKILGRVGFVTKEAVNGDEAVKLWKDWKPGIILMDLIMPVLNGMDAIKIIRSLPGGREPAIIAVTASVMREEKPRVLAGGADDFLGKPFREYELFNSIMKHAHIEFVYEDTEEQETLHPSIRSLKKRCGLVPEKIREDFIEALKMGHTRKISESIDKISIHEPELAPALKEMADAYDHRSLLALFRKE